MQIKRASTILEEIQRDIEFIERLEGRKPTDRLHYLVRKKRDILYLSNLKRNWLLVKINNFIDLDLCPLFSFDEEKNRQYCNPEVDANLSASDVLKLSSKGIIYSSDEMECNCDLQEVNKKGCQKMAMLS